MSSDLEQQALLCRCMATIYVFKDKKSGLPLQHLLHGHPVPILYSHDYSYTINVTVTCVCDWSYDDTEKCGGGTLVIDHPLCWVHFRIFVC